MNDSRCSSPVGFAAVVDYWAGELSRAEEDRIDEHVFTCAWCARELAAVEALARGMSAMVRAGRLVSVVSDTILNRLAADGVRIRTFTLDGPAVVPCAVWAEDDLVVTRIRGDFAEVDSVTVVTRQATGEEIGVLADVMVRPDQREILNAFSAAHLRTLPATRVLVTVTGQMENGQRTLAQYTLEHAGAFERPGGGR